MNKKIRESYEKKDVVLIYDKRYLQKPEEIVFEKYKDRIIDKHILDIGCGAGRTTYFLKKYSDHYIGFDYSYAMIEFCKEKVNNTQLLQCDVRHIAFRNEKFDFVLFSKMGLDDITHDGRLKGLQEIHRVLKENGIFVFSSNNRKWIGYMSHSKIKLSKNPRKLIRNIAVFVKQNYLILRNRKQQISTESYAMINEFSHGEALLSYHIDKKSQILQLYDCGFETIEMYDQFGNTLHPDSDDIRSRWIHYVARKKCH
jgi:ubiquinone/menaquinone biosynthesis C-methylase UbiE